MARFYASIQGKKGAVSRTGDADSGIEGHICSWHVGAEVHVVDENGHDVVLVYATDGRTGARPKKLIARFTADAIDSLKMA